MRQLLRGDDGPARFAAGHLFPAAVDRYYEGIDSERGIEWRAADSLALREFLGVSLDETPTDFSTMSRTGRLIALETHRAVFTWILQRLGSPGLVKAKTIGVDATTLEANAAVRSIVRRDSGESYEEFLTKLAKASGIGTPTGRHCAADAADVQAAHSADPRDGPATARRRPGSRGCGAGAPFENGAACRLPARRAASWHASGAHFRAATDPAQVLAAVLFAKAFAFLFGLLNLAAQPFQLSSRIRDRRGRRTLRHAPVMPESRRQYK